jgi:hypothetical protein
MPKSRSKLRGLSALLLIYTREGYWIILLMLLGAYRAWEYLKVCICIGRIGLIVDFFAQTNGCEDTHDPD